MKNKEKDQVREYYEKHVSEEDRRLDENVFEIPLTMQYIERYLQPGSKILDIACGTGKYAGLLLAKAGKSLRIGGYVFSAFMSRTGAIVFPGGHNGDDQNTSSITRSYSLGCTTGKWSRIPSLLWENSISSCSRKNRADFILLSMGGINMTGSSQSKI